MLAFGTLHPVVLLVWFTSVLVVSMLVFDPIIGSIALLGAVLCTAVSRRRGEKIRISPAYLVLFLTVTLTNPLFVHEGTTQWFSVFGKPFTAEALAYGATAAAAIVSVLLWCTIGSKLLSSDKRLFLFGKTFPALSLTLSASLRFLPLLTKRLKQVRRAQKTMGLYSHGGFWATVKTNARGFLAVIGWSLEHAMETAAAMKARAYGSAKRTTYAIFRWTVRDGVALAFTLALLGMTLYGIAAGAVYTSFYPTLIRPGTTPAAIVSYLAFGTLTLFPTVTECKEAVVWNRCKHRSNVRSMT